CKGLISPLMLLQNRYRNVFRLLKLQILPCKFGSEFQMHLIKDAAVFRFPSCISEALLQQPSRKLFSNYEVALSLQTYKLNNQELRKMEFPSTLFRSPWLVLANQVRLLWFF